MVLKNIAGALNENGILLLDVPNRESPEATKEDIGINDYGEFLEILETRFEDPFYIFQMDFYKKRGKDLEFLERHIRKVRLYSLEEYKNMFEKCGLELLAAWEGMRKANKHSRRFVLVGKKMKPTL